MIYISAGHYDKDPGAVAHGLKEADLTKELRDLVIKSLKAHGASFIQDNDSESLAQYIARIKPGDGSVLCEIHFNAGSETATGVETIFAAGPGHDLSQKLAFDMSAGISLVSGLANRGHKDETQSHRGRLGILHTPAGIAVLTEICFITNTQDIAKYQAAKQKIAESIALNLIAYDKLK